MLGAQVLAAAMAVDGVAVVGRPRLRAGTECLGLNCDEGYFESLVDQGFDEASIVAAREESERLTEPGVIWRWELWPTVQVFLACHRDEWPIVAGDKLVKVFLGIPAAEVNAACVAHRIPRTEWQFVLWAVRRMAAAALPILNAPEE